MSNRISFLKDYDKVTFLMIMIMYVGMGMVVRSFLLAWKAYSRCKSRYDLLLWWVRQLATVLLNCPLSLSQVSSHYWQSHPILLYSNEGESFLSKSMFVWSGACAKISKLMTVGHSTIELSFLSISSEFTLLAISPNFVVNLFLEYLFFLVCLIWGLCKNV